MPWLRLDLCRGLVFPARLLFRDGFRSALEVFFAEFKLGQLPPTLDRRWLGFEDYGWLPCQTGDRQDKVGFLKKEKGGFRHGPLRAQMLGAGFLRLVPTARVAPTIPTSPAMTKP